MNMTGETLSWLGGYESTLLEHNADAVVSNVRVYDRAITQQEVTDIYNFESGDYI